MKVQMARPPRIPSAVAAAGSSFSGSRRDRVEAVYAKKTIAAPDGCMDAK